LIDFKFVESVPAAERLRVIEVVEGFGVRVAPLFPGESDPELSSMFRVVGLSDGRVGEIVFSLGGLDGVEWAERSPGRKLIR
jgi:hypothetical protein